MVKYPVTQYNTEERNTIYTERKFINSGKKPHFKLNSFGVTHILRKSTINVLGRFIN